MTRKKTPASSVHRIGWRTNVPCALDQSKSFSEKCKQIVSEVASLEPAHKTRLHRLEVDEDFPENENYPGQWWDILCESYGYYYSGHDFVARGAIATVIQQLFSADDYFERAAELKSVLGAPLSGVANQIVYLRNEEGEYYDDDDPLWAEDFFDPTLMMLNAERIMESGRFIMISIDLEFDETCSDYITEIGISVAQNLQRKGSNWLVPDIKTFHIIVAEDEGMTRNGRYVPDHRDFSTQAISVTLCEHDRHTYVSDIIKHYEKKATDKGVPFVYVGHSVRRDLNALIEEGYDLPAYPVLDTSKIWTYPLASHQISLENLLKEVRLQQQFLHNAANDAFATLLALQRMCDPSWRKNNMMMPLRVMVEMKDLLLAREKVMRTTARDMGIQISLSGTQAENFYSDSESMEDGSSLYYRHDIIRPKDSDRGLVTEYAVWALRGPVEDRECY